MFQLLPVPHADFAFQALPIFKSKKIAWLSFPHPLTVSICLPFGLLCASFSLPPLGLAHPMPWRF